MEIQKQYCRVCRRVRETDSAGIWGSWRELKPEDNVAEMESVNCPTCDIAKKEARATRHVAVVPHKKKKGKRATATA